MSGTSSTDAGVLRAQLGAGTRRWFALVSTLAFAAIVSVAVYSYSAIHRELTESALSRRSSLSELTAATLSEKFKRALDVSISLATRVRFRDLVEAGEWAAAARILRDAPADFEFAERIGLIDLQGALLAGVPEVPVPGRQNFADRDWFQAARAGKPHVSHIFKRAAPPQENVFVAAVPIRSSKGELVGVLVVQMAVARFFDWIRAIDIGPDGLIYVIDPRGMLAFHPTLPLREELVDFSSVHAVRQALGGKRGVETMFNPIEKEERVSAFAPLPGSGWGVVVAEPSAVVFETRNRSLGLAAVAYLLVLVFFAAFVANRNALYRTRIEEQRRAMAEREHGAEEARRRAQDALARHGERLRIVHEIDRAIVANAKPEAIAAAVLQPLRDLLDVSRVNVNMLDYGAGEAEWMAAAGQRRTHVGPGVRFPMRFLGDVEALKRGEAQAIDSRALPEGPARDALLASGVNYYMAVPMIVGGELIGALSFGGEQNHFPEEQVLIAREVAMQLAIAISQARLFERVKQQAEELEHRVRERTSELEIANRELESSEKRYRTLFETMDEGFCVIEMINDPDGKAVDYRFMEINPAFMKHTGLADALSKTMREMVPNHDEHWFRIYGEVARTGESVRFENPAVAMQRYYDVFAFRVGGEGSQSVGIFFKDITQRKRAEDEIVTLNATLEQRSVLLKAANKELESFSYSVSHDLRAPLRAIDGYALMLAEDYGSRLDEEGLRLLNVVRGSATQMGQLIDDLLKFSQIGRRPLAPMLVDMRSLAGDVVAEATQLNPKVRVELGPLPAAKGDRALLRQVWSNLVGNAIKYSARSDLPRVEISGRSNGAETTYTVCDNGAGFDMRYHEKLFKVFQRLHGGDEFEGTGVGLAIVQRVISRHGGRVWGEGAVGKGASFHFTLPKET